MYNSTTPTSSIMEDGHAKWREIHSPSGWTRLIHDDQPDPWLKQEIICYGVFSHAAITAFKSSESCPNHLRCVFEGLHRHYGYKMTKLIHAHIDWPSCIGELLSSWMGKQAGKKKNDSNLIGYVAVSDDDMSRQIGRRDIVVAWRGTAKLGELLKDLQIKLKKTGTDNVRVAAGFHSIYTFKRPESSKSASEEVMEAVTTLVQLYEGRGEVVGLTITGHSLGGALALLNAHEAATSFPRLPISVISFGAPRVGNISFRDELSTMENVKILRVVNKSDIVKSLPGVPYKERIEKKFKINLSTDKLVKKVGLENRFYTHVGEELMLDAKGRTPCQAHELKTYLSFLSGPDSVGFKIPCACSPECYVGCVGE